MSVAKTNSLFKNLKSLLEIEKYLLRYGIKELEKKANRIPETIFASIKQKTDMQKLLSAFRKIFLYHFDKTKRIACCISKIEPFFFCFGNKYLHLGGKTNCNGVAPTSNLQTLFALYHWRSTYEAVQFELARRCKYIDLKKIIALIAIRIAHLAFKLDKMKLTL